MILQQRGLRANELRWLIFKGWIVHAYENTSRSSVQRSFVEAGPGWFDKTSCFALTPGRCRGAKALGFRGRSCCPWRPKSLAPRSSSRGGTDSDKSFGWDNI